MSRTDQLLDAYFSTEGQRLRTRKHRTLVVVVISGILAVISFGTASLLIVLAFAGFHPLGGLLNLLAIILAVALVPICVITCWVANARLLMILYQLRALINQRMAQPENANPPPPHHS